MTMRSFRSFYVLKENILFFKGDVKVNVVALRLMLP